MHPLFLFEFLLNLFWVKSDRPKAFKQKKWGFWKRQEVAASDHAKTNWVE